MTKEELVADLLQEIGQLEKQMLEQMQMLAALKGKVDLILQLPPDRIEEEKVELVNTEEPMLPKIVVPNRTSVYDVLEQKQGVEFGKLFSLNDRFRFKRDLFAGDEEKMSRTFSDINKQTSYESAKTYLQEELNWNMEDVNVVDFLKLVEKRFPI